jgi:hypothetical protein
MVSHRERRLRADLQLYGVGDPGGYVGESLALKDLREESCDRGMESDADDAHAFEASAFTPAPELDEPLAHASLVLVQKHVAEFGETSRRLLERAHDRLAFRDRHPPLTRNALLGMYEAHFSRLDGRRDNEASKTSGKKVPDRPSQFGLNKRLNRRFRKQNGGLLIRGSEVRILPGASNRLQESAIRRSL